MKSLLEQSGYVVLKPHSLVDMGIDARGCDAAAISLGLISDIAASVEDVAANIHRANSEAPIIFASLLPFGRAVSTILDLLGKLGKVPV
jgi:hypothetical protein